MNGRAVVQATLTSALLVACSDVQPMEPPIEASPPASIVTQAIGETPFTATDVPVAAIDPGVTRATPARIVLNGVTVAMYIEASDPRLTGFGQVVANGVLDPATGSGPVWGTFFIEANQGGRWVGNWHGQRAPAGGMWIADIEWTGRGEGSLAGLHLEASEIIASPTLVPSAYFGQVTGLIRER